MPEKTFGEISFERNCWVVNAQPDVAIRLKRIFPRVLQSRGEIRLANTADIARDLEWVLERWPMEISDTDRTRLVGGADDHRATEQAVLSILSGGANRPEDGWRTPSRPARPAQLQAADLGLTTKGTLCTDALGGGKSMTSLMLLRAPDALPALVVTQTHLTGQWADEEIPAAWRDLRVHTIKTLKPYDLSGPDGDPDIIVINYAKLRGWGDHLAGKIRTVIFDEIQDMRRPGTARYAAGAQIADGSRYRFGTSGTPVYNYGDEIFPIVDLLSPGALGSKSEFEREWCVGRGNKTMVRDPAALGTWLRDQGLMIGRTLPEMGIAPPTVPIEVPHFVAADEDEYMTLAGNAVGAALRLVAEDSSNLTKLQAGGELDWRLRQATGLAKAGFVADTVRMLVETQGPVVLFGWHRAVYERWLDLLDDLNPVMFTGSETPAAKDRSKKAFIDGESQVLIMSLRSGGGLNGLQNVCNQVVFGELDWAPAIHKQGIGRLDRPGQTKQIIAYYLYSAVGSDPLILQTLDIKRNQADPMMRPDQALLRPVTGDPAGRMRKLAQDFLRKHGVDPDELPEAA